jgi:YHS domain-containing protein
MLRKIAPLLLLVLASVACEQKTTPTPGAAPASSPLASASPAQSAASATAAPAHGLTLVRDRNLVCMVNDQYMGVAQIPVSVADKTYYGCCPMCKGRLEQDAAVRVAKDPVSGVPVDKSTAVIARAPSGGVLYFESERTLAQYKL